MILLGWVYSYFLAGKSFHFDEASTEAKSFTYNFTLLVTRRTFPRLASGCIHLKPLSSTTHDVLVPGAVGYIHIILQLLALQVWATALGAGTVDARRIFDTICILGRLAKTITQRSDWEPCKYICLNPHMSVLCYSKAIWQGKVCQRGSWSGDCGLNQLVLNFLTVTKCTEIWDNDNTAGTLLGAL